MLIEKDWIETTIQACTLSDQNIIFFYYNQLKFYLYQQHPFLGNIFYINNYNSLMRQTKEILK